MIPLNVLKRQCSACCTAVGVEELGKPSNFKCEKGCGISGKHPLSCQEYKCVWLEGVLPIEDRPDKLGVVFHVHEELGHLWLDAHVLPIGEKQRDKVKRACLQLLKENPFLHLSLLDKL